MPIGASALKSNMKLGTCPHGLPLGACPICNGAAGGNSTTKRDIPRNVGEMSYNQCAAIGAMLKAQKNARAQVHQAQVDREQAFLQFSKNIAAVHQRLADLSVLISKNFPAPIASGMNFVINIVQKIFRLPLQIVNSIPVIIQKFTDISDKLTAIYGEFKAAIKDKVSKFLTDFKKKFKSIFFVFASSETDDDEKKIEEAKRTFHLKTFIHKLTQKLKKEGHPTPNPSPSGEGNGLAPHHAFSPFGEGRRDYTLSARKNTLGDTTNEH